MLDRSDGASEDCLRPKRQKCFHCSKDDLLGDSCLYFCFFDCCVQLLLLSLLLCGCFCTHRPHICGCQKPAGRCGCPRAHWPSHTKCEDLLYYLMLCNAGQLPAPAEVFKAWPGWQLEHAMSKVRASHLDVPRHSCKLLAPLHRIGPGTEVNAVLKNESVMRH